MLGRALAASGAAPLGSTDDSPGDPGPIADRSTTWNYMTQVGAHVVRRVLRVVSMIRHTFLMAALLWTTSGCTTAAPGATGPVTTDPEERATSTGGAATASVPEPSCASPPTVGPTGHWRHSIKSPIASHAGAPRHRGLDLITGAGAARQAIRGEIRYGLVDKALEDESVELFACRAGSWRPLGSTLTDGEGSFELDLDGDARLPVGLRTLYASVVGDRSSATFVALVAPDGAQLVVSDVDGTLTSSENAFPAALVTGAEVAPQEGAPAALATLRALGYLPVYVTARGRTFTEDTRSWLDGHGFPRGPLRLAPTLITLPGGDTSAYKGSTLAALGDSGLVVAIGIGNRATDSVAYRSVGVPGNRIFLKQPEFTDENAPVIASGNAVGFASYVDQQPLFAALPPAP
jgi:LNS2-like protein (lipin/Ned1/Smp2)